MKFVDEKFKYLGDPWRLWLVLKTGPVSLTIILICRVLTFITFTVQFSSVWGMSLTWTQPTAVQGACVVYLPRWGNYLASLSATHRPSSNGSKHFTLTPITLVGTLINTHVNDMHPSTYTATVPLAWWEKGVTAQPSDNWVTMVYRTSIQQTCSLLCPYKKIKNSMGKSKSTTCCFLMFNLNTNKQTT